MIPQTGTIVWLDGDTPAFVVGAGTDGNGNNDGRIFVVELGSVTTIQPNDEGGYNFGATPYAADASKDNPHPGGFGPDTTVGEPVVARPLDTSQDGLAYDAGGQPITTGEPASVTEHSHRTSDTPPASEIPPMPPQPNPPPPDATTNPPPATTTV